jgi:hypothetical protein
MHSSHLHVLLENLLLVLVAQTVSNGGNGILELSLVVADELCFLVPGQVAHLQPL